MEKMKTDFENLEKKFNVLTLEKKSQDEQMQTVKKEKMIVDSEKKELEKLLIQEKAKVAKLEKELLKAKQELQVKTAQIDDFKLSM